MTGLVQVLYNYALSDMADRYLLAEKEEYESCIRMYERAAAELRARLEPAGAEELEKAVDGLEGRAALEREALFLSGLSMGLALGRLPG